MPNFLGVLGGLFGVFCGKAEHREYGVQEKSWGTCLEKDNHKHKRILCAYENLRYVS